MKITSFSKTYDKTRVLDFSGLELQRGNVYCIIGANGSGKSTFAKILAGVLPADQKGRHLDETVSLGYMPQKSYGFRMSTRSNILLGGGDKARAEQLMEIMQIQHLASKRANKLSGGETARMALVRVLMSAFDLLILDEPTAAMDMETTVLAESLMLDYVKETNCVLLLITHSLQQARRMADKVLFFYKGKLLETGSRDTVLYTPVHEETRQFLNFYGIS